MTTITALPTPPTRDDPTSFKTRADAFLAALPTFATECNTVASEVNADKITAGNYASTATSQAATATTKATEAAASVTQAQATANVTKWISGNTYAQGDNVWSPANFQTYRRAIAGAGTTDPSADATNWALVGSFAPPIVVVSGTSQAAVSNTHYVLTNVAATTVTLPASPAAGDVVMVTVANGLATNSIARNAKSIMGLAEDMTIDNISVTVSLRYLDATRMWRII